MATKMVQMWYLSDKDKEEIKSYSKRLTIFCKIKGYKPGLTIDNYLLPKDLAFIPCIKEWIDFENPHYFDYFKRYKDVINAINSAYDPSVKLSLEDLKEIKKDSKTERVLMDMLMKKDKDTVDDLFEFICSCGDEVMGKLVNWIVD